MTAACTLFGISRKTGYKWLGRAADEGLKGLAARSSRPHSSPTATPAAVVAALVAARRAHPTWGARKLLVVVGGHAPDLELPAASTVTALLKRQGMVVSRSTRARHPPRSTPLADATAANASWSIDFKGDFLVGDGTRCYPLTVTDNFSRMVLCCQSLPRPNHVGVVEQLERTFRRWGLPERLRSDNGHPFGVACQGPMSRLSAWLIKLGVLPEYISAGQPQQNGRHERFHRTLKAETARPPARSIAAQQRRFDAFCREFNRDRPHEALGQRPPERLHVRSPRPFPTSIGDPTYPGYYERRRIDNGYVLWKSTRLFLGRGLDKELVGLVEIDQGCWEIYFGPLCLGRIHDGVRDAGLVRQPPRLSPMSPV